ncbi:FAD/NAD(P)-binding domain-containing protein [Rhizophagus irregularis]|uniref:FAD/NAD(P)-binding domain-containing protein n=1 Tax=Rhizophagus irregularis TaxID=588596 RepID=A0A2N0NY20_9GLOM|nr:FAD/NAD(P)-binding domain-containing protein [Rhizophagus irregularis]
MQQKLPTVIIVGAGLGGLTLYHALIKNKDKKEFNVKIFDRESSPQDRWQGYHICINNYGARSLINCIPSSIALNLPKAMPNPVPNVEYHGFSLSDHTGNLLLRPPTKQAKDVFEVANTSVGLSVIITYRDKLRHVLLENVPVQWGKKCIGYEETDDGVWVLFEDGSKEFCDILVGADGINSPVRKQKLPELQIFDYGVTIIVTDVTAPKNLIDRLIKLNGNDTFQGTVGLNGEVTATVLRFIPIEQNNDEDKSDSYYRTTIFFEYPTKLDDDQINVDDNDPASVADHVKYMIRKLRPECELTNIILELWDLVPKTTSKTYNPTRRRKLQDIDPLSVNTWTSNRITLLGDAAHATSPVLASGANNAIQDAEVLSQALLNYSSENYISCIKEYETEMLKRSSADVLNSRFIELKQTSPVGYIGSIFRNNFIKISNFTMNLFDYNFLARKN